MRVCRYITAVIRSRLGLTWVTGGDVEHTYGVLKTNGVGQVCQGARACYLYPEVSLMSHSCLPNTRMVSSSPARQISFVAATDIKAGSELSWNYSNILFCRQQRQKHLASTWLFDCRQTAPLQLRPNLSHAIKTKLGRQFPVRGVRGVRSVRGVRGVRGERYVN